MSKKRKLSLVKSLPNKHKFNSFFAGIGGFDLGFEKVGITPALHCENNLFCNSVLKRHWPKVPSYNDICEVKVNDIPEAEIWCGGFPCQDVSVARSWHGREGLKGKNSGLFFPFLKLIKSQKPKVLILENVTGLLSSHKGEDFKVIIQSLTDLGYGVAWRVLNTRYFGNPQSRPRVYISASKGSLELAIKNLYELEVSSSHGNARQGFLTPSFCKKTKAIVPQVSYCLAATSGRHTGTDWSRSYVSYHNKVRRLTPKECEGLQGFPVDWSLPGSDFHLDDDNIDTLRYHALGNAVSVSVVEWIGSRIIQNLSQNNSALMRGKVTADNLVKKALLYSKVFSNGTPRIQNLNEVSFEDSMKWKSGGCAYKNYILDIPVSPAPNKLIKSRLIDIIEKREIELKYFLSSNAAEGILRRVNSQGRTLFGPLYKALHRLAKIELNHEDDQNDITNQRITIVR